MDGARPRLTPQLIRDLSERIKGGAFEQVAAESLGVPFDLYQRWLARGRQPRGPRRCRELVRAVRQAKAHARLMAEMDLRANAPKVWLLHGPGKETASLPGWSTPSRAHAADPKAPFDPLQHPEVVALFKAIDEALVPFPEARAAVLRVVNAAAIPDPK